MRIRPLLVALVAGTLAGPAWAQQEVIPYMTDLSGTWVANGLPPGQSTGEREVRLRCLPSTPTLSNEAIYGQFTMTLDFDRYEFERGTFNSRHYIYTGELIYPQAYASAERIGNSSDYAYNPFCQVEVIRYPVIVTLTTGGGTVPQLTVEGGPVNEPPYQHPSGIGLRIADVGLAGTQAGINMNDKQLFTDETGEVLRLAIVPFGFDTNDDTPEGCPYPLRVLASSINLTTCRVAYHATVEMRRGAPGNFDPRGPITGTLREALPDGTPTGENLAGGRVALYRHDAPLRDRGPSETALAYRDYLEANRTLVGITSADTMGRFAFDDVKKLERVDVPGRRSFRRILYSVEVSGVTKDEPDLENPPRVISVPFAVQRRLRVRVENDLDFLLVPSASLETKRMLAEALGIIGPNQYAPVENDVLAYIFLLDGGALTDGEIEALNRAIWAERAVMSGAPLAKDLLGLTVGQFLSTINEFVVGSRFNLKTKQLRVKERRLGRLRDAQEFNNQNRNRFAAGRSWENNQTREALDTAMEKIYKDHPSLRLARPTELLKKGLSTALYPVKVGLTSAGLSEEDAEALVGFIEDRLFVVLDAVQGDFNGVVKEIVKALGGPITDQVFDSLYNGIPSYTGMTRGALSNSYDRMRVWSTDDRNAYAIDRTRTVGLIGDLTQDATDVLVAATFAQGFAEGFGNAAEIYELGKANPYFRAAALASKILKYLSQAEVFVHPIVHAFGFMPSQSNAASYAAWGMLPPIAQGQNGQRIVTTTDPALGTTAVDALDALETQADRLVELLDDEEGLEEAALLIGGADGMLDQLIVASTASDRLLLQLEGASDPTLSEPLLDATFALAELDYRSVQLFDEFDDLLGDVIDGVYERPGDGKFRNDLRFVQHYARLFATRVRDTSDSVRGAFQRGDGVEVLPALAIGLVQIENAAGDRTITSATDTFTVSAEITNISPIPIDGFSVVATVTPATNATIAAGREVAVASLAAGASQTVTWTMTYAGDPEREAPISVSIEAREQTMWIQSRARTGVLEVDPTILDADFDAMPAGWELDMGLDPTVDDSEMDLDGDGLTNGEEYLAQTRADRADTDADGRSDFEELDRSSVVTDPTNPDTDGDGTLDGADGAPTDGFSTTATAAAAEPVVQLSETEVILVGEEALVAGVTVTNGGGGRLLFAASSSHPELVGVSPALPRANVEGGKVTVTLRSLLVRSGAALNTPRIPPSALRGTPVTITVRDVSGEVEDEQTFTVWVGEKPEPQPDGGVPGDGGPTNPMRDAGPTGPVRDAGPLISFGPGPDDQGSGGDGDGGCGCSTSEGSRGTTAFGIMLVLVFSVRRRRT